MVKMLLYPRVLYVVNRHSKTIKNLNTVLADKLIPASAMLPGVALDQKLPVELVQIIESLSLEPDIYKQTYAEINALKCLDTYEWVVLDRPGSKLLATAIEGYVYMSSAASPVHHYIRFTEPSITIPYANIDAELMQRISKATNLSELPASAAELINAHRPGSLRRTRVYSETINKLMPPPYTLTTFPIITTLSNADKQLNATTDEVFKAMSNQLFESYFATALLLYDFLNTELTQLIEQFSGQADLEYTGTWHDGRTVVVQAHRLIGSKGQGGWKVIGITVGL